MSNNWRRVTVQVKSERKLNGIKLNKKLNIGYY